MTAPRLVIGWREQERRAAETQQAAIRGFAGLRFTGRYRKVTRQAQGEVRTFRVRVYAPSGRTAADAAQRAHARREYKARWAREHPQSRKRWRAAHRDQERATARACYYRHLESRRERARQRARERIEAIKAEGGAELWLYLRRRRVYNRRYRIRLAERRAVARACGSAAGRSGRCSQVKRRHEKTR